MTEVIHPGMVDVKAIKSKLSKQLRIDLEPHEKVHLYAEPVSFPDMTQQDIEDIVNEKLGDVDKPCTVQVKELGEYIARIALQGGFLVPLKVEVMRRWY